MMKTGVRLMLCLLGCAAATILMLSAQAIQGPPPFQFYVWSADRIIIGTAVSVDDGTAQIAVERYIRDRTHDAPRRIHAQRPMRTRPRVAIVLRRRAGAMESALPHPCLAGGEGSRSDSTSARGKTSG